MVSVIIPAYNGEEYIRDALLSVYNQTYQDIELVIIDDGSTDKTAIEIDSFLHMNSNRFTNVHFSVQENIGVSATLNKAVSLCTSEWIYYLASDDLFLPNKIEVQQKAIKTWNDDSLALVYTVANVINADGSTQPRVNRWFSSNDPEAEAYKWLYYRNNIDASTVAMRKSALESIGGFDESLKVEDWDCWLRLSVHYSIARIPERLACKRYHSKNTSNDKVMMASNITATLDKFKSNRPDLVTKEMDKERFNRNL